MSKLLLDIRLLSQGEQTGVEVYTRRVIEGLLNHPPNHSYTLFYNAWKTAPLPPSWKNHPHAKVVNWGIPNKIFDVWQPHLDTHINTDLVYSPHMNLIRTARAPRILTIHDLSFIHFPEFFPLRYRFWHWRQNIKQQAYEAAAIVTDSEYTKRDIVKTLGVPSEKIHVIYPGIDPATPPNLLKSGFDRLSPERFILYLATLEPRKNIPAVISAFGILKKQTRFKDLRLVIVGQRSWRFTPIPYPDVIYWGPASTQEKALLYTKAEAFVYPSFFEGFGFPPLEAQSYGCPVVASNRSSLPEVLGSSALLVDPWHTHECAAALETLLTDTDLRTTYVSAGYENVARFNWNTTLWELEKLFSRFASSSS